MTKFGILAVTAVFGAFFCLACVSSPEAQGGLFGNRGGVLGLGILAQNCGGGGLQSADIYSGCSQSMAAYSGCSSSAMSVPYNGCGSPPIGGGGGGLQMGVQYYQTPVQYYSPASYYQPAGYGSPYNSGCPGGMCLPPAGGGLVQHGAFAPVTRVRVVPSVPVSMARAVRPIYSGIPEGIRLKAGERYVVGSLHRAERKEVRVAETKPKLSLPKGQVLYQLGYEGCVHCEADLKMMAEAGLQVKQVDIEQEPELARKLVKGFDLTEIEGYPIYVLTIDGRPDLDKWRTKPVETYDDLVKMASYEPDMAKSLTASKD